MEFRPGSAHGRRTRSRFWLFSAMAAIQTFSVMQRHCQTCREAFLDDWARRVAQQDPAGYEGCRSVHE
eukprot:11206773-Lingulodinium_polyedra.AAC.1